MRKILYITALSTLFFIGCSKKMPVAIPGTEPTTPPSGVVDEGSLNPNNNGASMSGELSSQPSKSSFQKGAVNAEGKYTGSDGVSKSGVKLLYFASDSYTLDDDQIQRLMSDLPKVKRLASQGKIIVEGNCDEFGTDEYNHALGLKRAKTVKKLLISAGIPAQKIDTVSYGESNPVCTINEPACHAKNRRAEINRI